MFLPFRFSVAPMMEWTDRHCRAFHRKMTSKALLYTEMVTTAAIIHGDRARLLGFSKIEQPVALQLGGSDPQQLAQAAEIGEQFGYCEINLNCGCPSDRVQSGRFGACLMAEPALVAEGVAAMKKAVKLPVTVKCRIGIDDQDSEADLSAFVKQCVEAGADRIVVHARKAWLNGLSPKDNRTIPPLDYERVKRLKENFAEQTIILNGGVLTLEAACAHLAHFDGVMMGRAAYHEPWRLMDVDAKIFKQPVSNISRFDIAQAMEPYMASELEKGTRLHSMTRHMLMLFQGLPGARAFRRMLSEEGMDMTAGLDVWRKAVACVSTNDKEEAA